MYFHINSDKRHKGFIIFQIHATMKHQVGAIMLTSFKHSLEIFVEFNLELLCIACMGCVVHHSVCSQ